MAVATFDGRDPQYDFGGRLIDLNLPSQAGPIGKWRCHRRRVQAVAGLITELRPDRVISFMEAANMVAIRAAQASASPPPIWVSIRCAPTAIPAWQQRLVRWHYPKADRIILQTEAARTHCTDAWRLPRSRCAVIANPMEAEWFAPAPRFPERERGLIVAIGRIEPVKGFDILIRACARLPGVRLVILGDGQERTRLQTLAASLGAGQRISLPGTCADPRPWLDRAGAFALSSHFEGFPNALAEAMARGCPVVCTDCPTGPREMVRDGESGLLVPVGDAAAMAQALHRLGSDDDLACRLGEAARSTATRWRIDRIAPAWLDD